MTKTKKILIILVNIIISILLTSCLGSRQLNTLGIVTAVGLDIENGKVLITCEIINPTSSNLSASTSTPTSENVIFAQGVGDTVFEAIRDITLHFDRKLFFSHSNILIFGEEFAKKGITDFMDIFLRDYEPRENSYMVVAKGEKAYEIIGVRGELSQSTGNYLYDVLDNYKYNGKSKNISMADYYRYYYDISNEPVIGTVEKIEKKVIDVERRQKNPIKFVLDVSGGAVFKRDYLVGYFSQDEMLGYNFIVGEIGRGLVTFDTPEGLSNGESIIGKEGKYTTVEILKSKTKKDITIVDDEIHLNIDVRLRLALGEENKAVDISNLKVIEILEKAGSQKVKNLIVTTMDKGQKEFKQDNFSIGELVHRQYPKIWREIGKDWNNIFPEISYSVNVETEIVKTGITNVPSNLRRRR